MARKTAHHKHAAKHMEKAEMHNSKAAKHHEMAKASLAKMDQVKETLGKLVKSDKKVHAKMDEAKAGKKADASKKHHEAESKGMKKYEAKEHKAKKDERKGEMKHLRKEKHTKF